MYVLHCTYREAAPVPDADMDLNTQCRFSGSYTAPAVMKYPQVQRGRVNHCGMRASISIYTEDLGNPWRKALPRLRLESRTTTQL